MSYPFLSIVFAIVLFLSVRFGTDFISRPPAEADSKVEPIAALFQPAANQIDKEAEETLPTVSISLPAASPGPDSISSSTEVSLPEIWKEKSKIAPLPSLGAKSALLYDLTEQKMLVEKKVDQALPIASITKLMTALIARERLRADSLLTISSRDLSSPGPHNSLSEGDILTLREAMYFLLVSSNNAVAGAIERLFGENKEFTALMNQRAKSLGMVSTFFSDAAGLADDSSWSTARDLLKLSLNLIESYPDLLQISRQAKITVLTAQGKSFSLVNTNELLNEIPQIIGGKTGFTERAGGCLLLIFEANGHTFVSVVLGSPDRFGDTKKLIQFARESL